MSAIRRPRGSGRARGHRVHRTRVPIAPRGRVDSAGDDPPDAGCHTTDPLVAAIDARLPGLRLLTDSLDREGYRDDETPYLHAGLPRAVVFPTTTADVVELVRIASELRVPIVPRGAGDRSVRRRGRHRGRVDGRLHGDGQAHRDRPGELVAVVQPGIINANLKAAVAAEGPLLRARPASFEMCSIGGNLGTNAGGLCCVKYGQTRDSVLSLEVVMADGACIRTGGKNVKDVGRVTR
jgi:glycolate oxidase